MNFFAQQDRARRNTFWLIALLSGAVTCLIALTIFAASFVMYYFKTTSAGQNSNSLQLTATGYLDSIFATNIPYWSAAGILTVVLSASLFKLIQLGGSGRRVAESLGGRLLMHSTNDADEKKVLNVVEEMAIASGNPVPPVYILDDSSINAFAAGMDRRSAVIGITRGCIQLLSREELQGVIAHEFSHIHFGDMRINLRLVAILHGILVIGLIGSYILQGTSFGHRGYYHNSNSRKNNNAQMALGLVFLILGYCGVFFGNIIKAAVSRQREFLADASAVQFTRNPDGIANALKKIGGNSGQAIITSPRASEFSHFYFGEGVTNAFGSMMATHPPLEKRIRRIQPRWDGEFIQASAAHTKSNSANSHATNNSANRQEQFKDAAIIGTSVGLAAIDYIGNPTADNLNNAKNFLQTLPQNLKDAAHDPFSARALVYSLLIDTESSNVKQMQENLLKKQAHPITYKTFIQLSKDIELLPRNLHLPLLDLTIPALKIQSKSQYTVFKKNIIDLIKADKQVSFFEWCLYRIVTQGYECKKQHGNKSIESMSDAVNSVLAAVCYSGKNRDASKAINAAAKLLPKISFPKTITDNYGSDISFQDLDKAIDQLCQLRPLDKPKFLKALAACIEADNSVTAEEAELFRAIADCLDCPLPMLTVG